MKFSIVIPVYNVEKYIAKCLDSVLKQTYADFEVIVVNDGSTDASESIIKEYEKKDSRICGYIKENGGLSDARNYGLQHVTGDYIVFLDSDDYLEADLLQKIYQTLNEDSCVDLVRYSFQKVDEDGNVLEKVIMDEYFAIPMQDAVKKILAKDFVEPAWSYAYRSDFFVGNGYQYPKGYYHEDYGLTPLVVLSAEKISSIPYIGLNYVQRSGSIMNAGLYEKEVKKAEDTYALFMKLEKSIQKLQVDKASKKMMMAFVTRVLMEKILALKSPERERYIGKLSDINVSRYFYQNGIKGFIKKAWAKVCFTSYCNHFYGE